MTEFLQIIDIPAIRIAIMASMVVVYLMAAAVWLRPSTQYYGQHWILGGGLLVLGMLLLALRGRVWDSLSIVLANALIVAGAFALLCGVRVFAGRPAHRSLPVVAGVGASLFFLYFTYIIPSAQVRVIFMTSIMALVCFLLTILLWRNFQSGTKALQRGIAGLLAMAGLYFGVVAITALVSANPETQSPAHTPMFLNFTLVSIVVMFTFTVLAQRRLQQQLEYDMRHDFLTGALDRRAFEEAGEQELAASIRYTRPLSLIFLDLDHFKRINDQYGHKAGDETLKRASQDLARHLRKSDVFARTGGEEFGILLPETNHPDALSLASRILREVEKRPLPVQGHEHITVSAGVASVAGGTSITWEAFTKAADDALYDAKHNGRNCVSSADTIDLDETGPKTIYLQQRPAT
jgi:diguanylate cyclase (GGDEF)-like protein